MKTANDEGRGGRSDATARERAAAARARRGGRRRAGLHAARSTAWCAAAAVLGIGGAAGAAETGSAKAASAAGPAKAATAAGAAVPAASPGAARAASPFDTTARRPELRTYAERSGWTATGRHAEVEQLCGAFAAAYPKRARCTTFGVTPEGRSMFALVASDDGVLDPARARERGRPVVLAQGGIHAGEIDGKDAGFALLADLLDGRVLPGALKNVTFVFVPIFNIDGHERFGPNNRPNQRGPEAMGWRTTAHNLNLNRDYVKAEAPEMRALLALLGAWDPVLYADLHATDGAEFQHDVAVMIEPRHAGPAPLRALGAALSTRVQAELAATGHLPLDFYPAFEVEDDPASGFGAGVAPPRFSHAYWSLRNRLGVLVETHSWKPYAERVRATYDVVAALLGAAAADGAGWRAAMDTADRAASVDVPGRPLAVAWQNGPETRTLEFLGYAYTREPSAVSGALLTRYDATRPEVWRVPFRAEVVPRVTVTAPELGYVVAPIDAAWVGEKLRAHGVAFEPLGRRALGPLERYRARSATFGAESYEGRQTLKVEGAWEPATGETPDPRALFVPVAQARAALVVNLLEPEAPDSLLAWGYFDAWFEQKEYLEAYVVESWASALLARDAAVAAEFAARLASDAAFAKDPAARLRFFAERHPAWDARYRVYPVRRARAAGTGGAAGPGAARSPAGPGGRP